MKNTVTHRFERGQKIHLHSIYAYQALGDDVDGIGRWWEADQEDGDELTVTQDIAITITIRTPNNGVTGVTTAGRNVP